MKLLNTDNLKLDNVDDWYNGLVSLTIDDVINFNLDSFVSELHFKDAFYANHKIIDYLDALSMYAIQNMKIIVKKDSEVYKTGMDKRLNDILLAREYVENYFVGKNFLYKRKGA